MALMHHSLRNCIVRREYLLLEYGNRRTRYYNFTIDPLQLLRLAKQHVPHLDLKP
jgi:hypothetical protein